LSTWQICTLGPAGTDHENAARSYCEHRGLDHKLLLVDAITAALPFVQGGPRRLVVVNSAHPDSDLLTTRSWRQVGIVDMFVMATKPLALVSRPGSKPGSIAIMPSTRGYVDLSRWERVHYVTAKPVALREVLAGTADSAIVSFDGYQAHRDQLQLDERIGPVECGWLVFSRRSSVAAGIVACEPSPACLRAAGEA
jgi:hypothetical protein